MKLNTKAVFVIDQPELIRMVKQHIVSTIALDSDESMRAKHGIGHTDISKDQLNVVLGVNEEGKFYAKITTDTREHELK